MPATLPPLRYYSLYLHLKAFAMHKQHATTPGTWNNIFLKKKEKIHLDFCPFLLNWEVLKLMNINWLIMKDFHHFTTNFGLRGCKVKRFRFSPFKMLRDVFLFQGLKRFFFFNFPTKSLRPLIVRSTAQECSTLPDRNAN